MTDWAERIGRHITPDGSVVVPPRIAEWLDKNSGMTDERRFMLRGTDALAYEVLAALHLVAITPRSDSGTKPAAVQTVRQQSEMWLTTDEAAQQVGVTDRCIRKWIATDRLPATKHGARWLINRNDLHIQAFAA